MAGFSAVIGAPENDLAFAMRLDDRRQQNDIFAFGAKARRGRIQKHRSMSRFTLLDQVGAS